MSVLDTATFKLKASVLEPVSATFKVTAIEPESVPDPVSDPFG